MFLNNRITGKGNGRLLVWFASFTRLVLFDEMEYAISFRPPIIYRKSKFKVRVYSSLWFYKDQLHKTDQNIYRIDRVIRRRRKPDGTKEVLVKWYKWPDKFNSWEAEENIYKSISGS